ncbi:MAG: PAS domain S-box protein, partial [Bacteroidetes bacterium]
MEKKSIDKIKNQLLFENEELRTQLAKANEPLIAIHNGEVDAIVISGSDGEKVFSLTSAETPYRVIVEEMNEGAVVLSADGLILYCNRRFAEIISVSLEQMVGSYLTRFIAERDRPKYDLLLQAGLKGKGSGEITYIIHNSDPAHLHLSFSPLPQDMLGDVCIMAADISELKQKEEEVHPSYETLEQRVIERTAELTKSIAELAVSRLAAMNMMEDTVKAKNTLEISNKKLFEEIAERKYMEKEIQRLNAGLEKSVTDRTAQLQAVNKELETFSYSVSHDLKAPLRAISGFTGILIEEYQNKLDAEGQRICNVIKSSAVRMSRLIEDLLAFSHLNRTELHNSAIDMKAMAASIYYECFQPEQRENISFTVRDIPRAFGDPSLIRQVWVNLISNAVKFSSKKDHPEINIGCKTDKNEIIYSISDNGTGFDMQYADKLFSVFQRLHESSEFEGTGIGLAIVKR